MIYGYIALYEESLRVRWFGLGIRMIWVVPVSLYFPNGNAMNRLRKRMILRKSK